MAFQPPLPLSLFRAPARSRCPRRVVRAVMSQEKADPIIDILPPQLPIDTSQSAIQNAADVDAIMALAEQFDLRDLRIVDHGVEIEITREGGYGFEDGKLAVDKEVVQVVEQGPGVNHFGEEEEEEEETVMVEEVPEVEEQLLEVGEEEDKDPDMVYESDFVVTSNRVGFFFSGRKNKPPLVNVGDKVAFNQPVCIIEQLGQQYVYLSEASGTVLKIFVEDGDAVEYSQQVMVIRPD